MGWGAAPQWLPLLRGGTAEQASGLVGQLQAQALLLESHNPATACLPSLPSNPRPAHHHQSPLGSSTLPTSAARAAPRDPCIRPSPRCQWMPSDDTATPARRRGGSGACVSFEPCPQRAKPVEPSTAEPSCACQRITPPHVHHRLRPRNASHGSTHRTPGPQPAPVTPTNAARGGEDVVHGLARL